MMLILIVPTHFNHLISNIVILHDFNELSLGVEDKHKAGFISNGNFYADYATLIHEVKLNAKGISHQNINVQQKKITVLSDKMVLMTASGSSMARVTDGREFTSNFHWSFVYEKINSEWKVIYSHQSRAK